MGVYISLKTQTFQVKEVFLKENTHTNTKMFIYGMLIIGKKRSKINVQEWSYVM